MEETPNNTTPHYSDIPTETLLSQRLKNSLTQIPTETLTNEAKEINKEYQPQKVTEPKPIYHPEYQKLRNAQSQRREAWQNSNKNNITPEITKPHQSETNLEGLKSQIEQNRKDIILIQKQQEDLKKLQMKLQERQSLSKSATQNRSGLGTGPTVQNHNERGINTPPRNQNIAERFNRLTNPDLPTTQNSLKENIKRQTTLPTKKIETLLEENIYKQFIPQYKILKQLEKDNNRNTRERFWSKKFKSIRKATGEVFKKLFDPQEFLPHATTI